MNENQVRKIRYYLKKENQWLHKSRSYGEKSNLGDWYITDISNTIIAYHVDLDNLAKELSKQYHTYTFWN